MRTLSNFLAALPGIRPIKARRLILQGDVLSKEARADIYCRNMSLLDTVVEVGPDAAAAILAAYKSGALPMQKKSQPEPAPEAESYLARADEFRIEAAERRRKDLATKDPSVIVEADFTNHRLMDSVFFANIGPGSGTMVLAGIKVQKSVFSYRSNSGQSTGWLVRFDWTGSDGERHHCETVPPEASNRRNDPDRNWGLYE